MSKNYSTYFLVFAQKIANINSGSEIREEEKAYPRSESATLIPLLLFFLSDNWSVEKMAKRNATTELTHDNWDQEEESEEAGTFKQVRKTTSFTNFFLFSGLDPCKSF